MGNNEKFCKFCGELIPSDAVICTKCGRQVEKIEQANAASNLVINNNVSSSSNSSSSFNGGTYGKVVNKWVAFFLCLFLGYLGAHKFYENKIASGILYLCTFGLFGIGWVIDLFIILNKPNKYLVN